MAVLGIVTTSMHRLSVVEFAKEWSGFPWSHMSPSDRGKAWFSRPMRRVGIVS